MSHVIIIMIHLETATSRRWGKAPAKHENYINTLWGVAGKVQTWTGARQISKATKIIGMLSQMPTHIHYTSARPMGSVCCILYCVCAQTFGQNVKTVACPRVFINASGGMLENTLNRCTFDMLTKGRNLDGGPKRKTRCAWRGVVGVYTGGQHCSTEASNYKFWVRDSWTIHCG